MVSLVTCTHKKHHRDLLAIICCLSGQGRSMGEDLRTMLCADNLAMAKSSLVHLLGFHSTASRLYYPWKCDAELREIARLHPETKVAHCLHARIFCYFSGLAALACLTFCGWSFESLNFWDFKDFGLSQRV